MLDRISPDILQSTLKTLWTRDTSADPDHWRNWSESTMAWGQCAVTALVVQDFLGGEIVRIDMMMHKDPLVAAMRSHYWNRVDGKEIDCSQAQFTDREEFARVKSLQEPAIRERPYLLSNDKTRQRYTILRLEITRIFHRSNPLFADPTYRRCLELALLSDCQKGKYGCVVKYGNEIIAETQNHRIDPLKDWSEPECIRMTIPSRTESMIGCCAHAEEFALVAIRDRGIRPSQCDLYVAGFRSNGLAYIKPDNDFTCLRCATSLFLHNVRKVFVPWNNTWGCLTVDQAIKTAKRFARQEKKI